MPEYPGFQFEPVHGRSVVRLRVRPTGANAAAQALDLPQTLRSSGEDPQIHWLGPDQWLLTSDTRTHGEIIAEVEGALSGQLHAATNLSSSHSCFALSGPAARLVLAMGCGIDLHPRAFTTGQCASTNFANVLLLMVCVDDDHFDLYVDRSRARYLSDWIVKSGEDPITRSPPLNLYTDNSDRA